MASEPIVYVIDDDDGARQSLEFLLDCAGIRVRSFASADAFLAASPPLAGACVVTDVRMPGPMSGYDLALKARERWPSLEIMFVSGFGLPERRRLYFDCLLVSKPFNPDEFVNQVRGLAERAN